MGFLKWMGFSKPRDAPGENLPEVTDSVRDSGQVFLLEPRTAGKR